jgi:hypothetical protein
MQDNRAIMHLARTLAELHRFARELGLRDVENAIRTCEVQVDTKLPRANQKFSHEKTAA